MLKDTITAFDGHITLEPVPEKVSVTFGTQVLAETRAAIKLSEGTYPPVYYIPRSDIDESEMFASSLKTKCPWKGEASYLSYSDGAQSIDNLVWMYPEVREEIAPIKDYVAFDTRQVKIDLG